jgi:hypothetical protein
VIWCRVGAGVGQQKVACACPDVAYACMQNCTG